MDFGIFSYAATVIIFPGLAILVRFLKRRYISAKSPGLSKAGWRIIFLTTIIAVVGTGPAEWIALTWRAWTYNPEKTLHATFLGAEVETYLFTILVSFVISIATIGYARDEDRKRNEARRPRPE